MTVHLTPASAITRVFDAPSARLRASSTRYGGRYADGPDSKYRKQPHEKIESGTFRRRIGQGMVASGKTLGLRCAKSKVPTFEPKVPSCPGFPAVLPRPHPLSTP
jgi:hypothetical protein